MASLTGAVGSVTIPGAEGPSLNIFEWSADIRRDIFEDSDFNSATNARSKRGGMADMVGTIRGRAKEGTTPGIGAMATLHHAGTALFYLEADGAVGVDANYKFTGIMSQMRISTPKVGEIEVSATFESTGVVEVNQIPA